MALSNDEKISVFSHLIAILLGSIVPAVLLISFYAFNVGWAGVTMSVLGSFALLALGFLLVIEQVEEKVSRYFENQR